MSALSKGTFSEHVIDCSVFLKLPGRFPVVMAEEVVSIEVRINLAKRAVVLPGVGMLRNPIDPLNGHLDQGVIAMDAIFLSVFSNTAGSGDSFVVDLQLKNFHSVNNDVTIAEGAESVRLRKVQ